MSRQGAFAPASTSLGAVLPASLGVALAAASHASDGAVDWRAASGRVHALRVVAAESALVSTGTAPAAALDDFGPLALASREPTRLTEVTAGGSPDAPDAEPGAGRTRAAARAVGTLVHRALAAGALAASAEGRASLVDEQSQGADAATRAAARRGLEALAARPDVAALISGAHVQHEVPVSVYGPDGTIVRAVVDMIVHRPDGVVRGRRVQDWCATPRRRSAIGGVCRRNRGAGPRIHRAEPVDPRGFMSFLSCACRKVATRLVEAPGRVGASRGAPEWR